ncbi:MAG TPA: hypothetical protein VFB89_13125 [Gemmatimonadales bacterium]|nr:hypothetical protein [Gemmatimonadales bacterium]
MPELRLEPPGGIRSGAPRLRLQLLLDDMEAAPAPRTAGEEARGAATEREALMTKHTGLSTRRSAARDLARARCGERGDVYG